jgi:hypothetical protein
METAVSSVGCAPKRTEGVSDIFRPAHLMGSIVRHLRAAASKITGSSERVRKKNGVILWFRLNNQIDLSITNGNVTRLHRVNWAYTSKWKNNLRTTVHGSLTFICQSAYAEYVIYCGCEYTLLQQRKHQFRHTSLLKTPWRQSASELYRPSDRRLS